jgi:hypothetical protein
MVVQYVRLQLPQGVNSEDSSVCKALLYDNKTPFDSIPQHLLQIAGLICHTSHNNKHYLLQYLCLYVTLLALVNARKTVNITMLAVG